MEMQYLYVIFLDIVCCTAVIILYRYQKKIRTQNLCLVLFLIFMIIVLQEKPDAQNYASLYYNLENAGKDRGFTLIAHIFSKSGLTYMQFQNLYCIIAVIIIAYALVHLANHRLGVYFLFLVYPFFLQLIQIRNFMCTALLFLACSICITTNQSYKRKWIWFFLIILAATQHVLALVFLPYIFFMEKNTYIKKIPFLMGIVTLVFLIQQNDILSLIAKIVKLLVRDFRADIFTIISTRFGWIIMIGKSIGLIFIASRCSQFIERYIQVTDYKMMKYSINRQFYQFIENLFEYGALFWPLYVINGNFARIMQDEAILIYIAVIDISKHSVPPKVSVEDRVYLYNKKMSIECAFCFLFLYDAFSLWVENYSTVIRPLINNFL